jgi:hypothetical protein
MKTQSRLMRDELGESLEHLRMAAAYAAGGTAEALAPRLAEAKKAAGEGLDSFVDLARDGAKTARSVARRGTTKMKKKSAQARRRRRWPMLVSGILVAGAAAGTVGALLSRRRTQRWQEYGAPHHAAGSMPEPARSAMETGAAGTAAGTAAGPTGRVGAETPREAGGTLGQYGQATGTGSRNSRA